jgi:hypothetical protein
MSAQNTGGLYKCHCHGGFIVAIAPRLGRPLYVNRARRDVEGMLR